MVPIPIELDLTPTWWTLDWWLAHSCYAAEHARGRSPEAVGYAIETIVRWVHPRATVVCSPTHFSVRFAVDSLEQYFAGLADHWVRHGVFGTKEELRASVPQTVEDLRAMVAERIESLVGSRGDMTVYITPPTTRVTFYAWAREMQLVLSGPGFRDLNVSVMCARSELEGLRDTLQAAAAALTRQLCAAEGEPMGHCQADEP